MLLVFYLVCCVDSGHNKFSDTRVSAAPPQKPAPFSQSHSFRNSLIFFVHYSLPLCFHVWFCPMTLLLPFVLQTGCDEQNRAHASPPRLSIRTPSGGAAASRRGCRAKRQRYRRQHPSSQGIYLPPPVPVAWGGSHRV